MDLWWAAAPLALILGAGVAARKVRTIAAEADEVLEIVERLDADRAALARIDTDVRRARASLDAVERR